MVPVFKESASLIILTKLLPHAHFCCRISVSSMHLSGMQFPATSPYYNPSTYTSCESLRNIQFSVASHPTVIKKKASTNHITHQYWVSSSACPYQGMARAMSMFYLFFTWAVVEVRQISRTIKIKLKKTLPIMYCLMTSLLECLQIYF